MFTRIITRKNGRQYLYVEERYREGGKVRSRSRCLGPVEGGTPKTGWLRAQFPRTYGLDWDAIEKRMMEKSKEAEAKSKVFAARMYLDYGMTLKTSMVPIEKVPSSIAFPSYARPSVPKVLAAVAPEAPSSEEGASCEQPLDDGADEANK